ncbi:TetR/AcrR family transcriptional regulator [Brachybacterium sp. GCM10030252]|uniref:TetR/AcrR family transcriptional regulator n=1 Tax=Brachybacterium sp. GCM10030252 TaxID=3273380 RepID=UPI003609ED5D
MPSSCGRAPDPRPARTRAAIFAAARDLSASDGEVTVNALVQRAGVSRAAFYSHFSGLDDLIGAMLAEMFDEQQKLESDLVGQGRSTHEMVQTTITSLVVYLVRHHAFLRGALDWKFAHRTYLYVVRRLSELHEVALRSLRDEVPSYLPVPRTARFFAGGTADVLIQWLVDTDEEAAAGAELDASELREALLRILPSWYTGLQPEDPIPPADVSTSSAGPAPSADET